eukprot:scaffold170384_cov17-Prasinocladus_malaysianus.AAC.1
MAHHMHSLPGFVVCHGRVPAPKICWYQTMSMYGIAFHRQFRELPPSLKFTHEALTSRLAVP